MAQARQQLELLERRTTSPRKVPVRQRAKPRRSRAPIARRRHRARRPDRESAIICSGAAFAVAASLFEASAPPTGRRLQSEIESLASPRTLSGAALQLRFAQNDSESLDGVVFQLAHIRRVSPIWRDEQSTSRSERRSRGYIAAGALCPNAGIQECRARFTCGGADL